MRKLSLLFVSILLLPAVLHATVFGRVQGLVHDTQHRPVPSATVTLKAANSHFTQTTQTNPDGLFTLPAVPLGDYLITVTQPGFIPLQLALTLASDTSPLLHFELHPGATDSVQVSSQPFIPSIDTATPTSLVSRLDIAQTPGAARTNSLAMITDFVPGAYLTHDQLHMRGGHQVTWQIDGVQVPNTDISSNLGAQIDPKDIDYLEVQRGSYTADEGDRTFGVFNVVPRSGFERNRDMEVLLSLGNYLQTNDQVNFGTHTEAFAIYASLSGNRSGYGLAPPISQPYHDSANGYGAFTSLLYNRTSRTQLRLVSQFRGDYFQIPYDPDPTSPGNQQYDSSQLRDGQHERDGLANFSYVHTFSSATVLQVSPFYHFNHADYQPHPTDLPVATNSGRTSNYYGIQTSITGQIARNTLQAGVFSYAQHEAFQFGSIFNDASAPSFHSADASTAGLLEAYISDNFKVTSWLTLIGGLRQSHFAGDYTEDHLSPRIAAAILVPRLHWVFRGFYGRFYQPPPLVTASIPILAYANTLNIAFKPLHGELDEEHQFGVQIPLRGWLLDADTFHTRARNFLDHSNLGESSIYLPVSIDGALINGWELSLRSPLLFHSTQAHLAHSNQVAKQRGALTGGLVCVPTATQNCTTNYTYSPLDHDQRNTLSAGFNVKLPYRAFTSVNFSYGSGFHNGTPDSRYPDPYLPDHTSFDLSVGKSFGQNTSLSINALNLANRRTLLDNSLTFGGFHYNDPRQIYAEIRFKLPL